MPQLHEIMLLAPKYWAGVFEEQTAQNVVSRYLEQILQAGPALSTFPSTLPVNAFEHRLLTTFQESLHFCIKHEIGGLHSSRQPAEAIDSRICFLSIPDPSLTPPVTRGWHVSQAAIIHPGNSKCHLKREENIQSTLLCTACFVPPRGPESTVAENEPGNTKWLFY